jgi:hypothetical protein
MFINSSAFPAELAEVGLAAAADPLYAERLMAALGLLEDPAPSLPNLDAEELSDRRHGAAA